MSQNPSAPDGSSLPASLASNPLALRPKQVSEAVAEATRYVLRRRFRVALLLRDAYAHMTAHQSSLTAVWDDLQTILRLLVAWAQRKYAEVPWTPVVLMGGALVYFVMPADAVPDLLGALGFVDDVAVITAVVHTVRNELDRFREWEAASA
jgi:uncharacterized membrane protein YkvA (DUF1232 family)